MMNALTRSSSWALLVVLLAPVTALAQEVAEPEVQAVFVRHLHHTEAGVVANVLERVMPLCGELADCTSTSAEAAASRIAVDDHHNQLLIRTTLERMMAIDVLIDALDAPVIDADAMTWREVRVTPQEAQRLHRDLRHLAAICGPSHPDPCAAPDPVSLRLVSVSIDPDEGTVLVFGHRDEVAEFESLVDLMDECGAGGAGL